ncbi:GDP-mannose 4,6-dehydratase [Streptococcus lutetiensis]|uniref:GDP-mannose 4,6-dehydratase n=1 Tax=Streptococcus lutetiensis TaxID=150055 RepID=UPI003DA5C877
MKILVTGSTGFIGSYFIPMLLHQGHTVKLLVRNEEKARKLFGNTCDYHMGLILFSISLRRVEMIYQLKKILKYLEK